MGGAFRAFIEHYEIIAYFFGSKFFVAFLIFPASGSEASFDIDQASFVKVFMRQFGQAAPKNYSMPFRL